MHVHSHTRSGDFIHPSMIAEASSERQVPPVSPNKSGQVEVEEDGDSTSPSAPESNVKWLLIGRISQSHGGNFDASGRTDVVKTARRGSK